MRLLGFIVGFIILLIWLEPGAFKLILCFIGYGILSMLLGIDKK